MSCDFFSLILALSMLVSSKTTFERQSMFQYLGKHVLKGGYYLKVE